LTGGAVAQKESKATTQEAANQASDPRTSLIDASHEYKSSAQQLAQLQEDEIKKASEKLEQLRQLVADGLVARIELDQGEQALDAIKAKLAATKTQISNSEQLIAQIEAERRAKSETPSLAARSASQKPVSYAAPTILRYRGSTSWSIVNLSGIEAFFFERFGHFLPTSAVGQSATHDRLGLDHRNAVDVALHPDSIEGKALVNYLQSQGIPFLAFRGPIPGVATGPHIHIGNASHRLA
jgi:vacuolar-type H+-ATPase subunit I/STV1